MFNQGLIRVGVTGHFSSFETIENRGEADVLPKSNFKLLAIYTL